MREQPTMVNVVKFMLLVFLVVPNGVALYIWKLSNQENQKAELVRNSTGFAAEGGFVAEGVLKSPSADSLTSRHFKEPCLAYRVRCDMLQTVTNSDGELEDVRSHIFDERQQVSDLTVEFSGGSGLLDLQIVDEFYQASYDEWDELPEYVEPSEVPTARDTKPRFEIIENIFEDGQEVTVVGALSPSGYLDDHPRVGELVVYPGDVSGCVAVLQKSRLAYRITAYVMVGISIFGCLILGIILGVMKKGHSVR